MSVNFKESLQKLREKLPHRYADLVAAEIEDETFTADKVRNIFHGRITDMVNVGLVISGANAVLAKAEELNRLATTPKKPPYRNRSIKSKKAA